MITLIIHFYVSMLNIAMILHLLQLDNNGIRVKSFSLDFLLDHLNNVFFSGSDTRDESIRSTEAVNSSLLDIKVIFLIGFVGTFCKLYVVNKLIRDDGCLM